MTDTQFNCAACLKKNKQQFRDTKKGCNKQALVDVAKYHEIYTFKRCPGALKSQTYIHLIEQHRQWELGVLPFEGGLLDQPAKYVEAMRLIESLKLEHQNDVLEKAKKWQKTKSASNSRSKQKTR